LCWLHWKHFSWQHWMIFRLFTFSSACVSALVIVLTDSPFERIGTWEICHILKEDRSLVRVLLENLWRKLPHYSVYRERQFLHDASWEDNFREEEQWAKINMDRKISSYIEKDCFVKSQNCCSTAELNIHLGDSDSTITVRRELHKSNIRGRAAIAKPLIAESNAQMRKRLCHDHKTWTWDNWNRAREVVLHAAPYVRKSLRLEDTQGSLQSGVPGSNTETQGRFCGGLGSNIMVQYSVGPIITLHGRITAREYVDRLSNQVHPMIQT
jgi:hypothetical protein